MAKNKAFVRYANNKAVPGSLIVRKKAPSVGVWKEIPYDLCCDNNNACECNTDFPTILGSTVPFFIVTLRYNSTEPCGPGLTDNYAIYPCNGNLALSQTFPVILPALDGYYYQSLSNIVYIVENGIIIGTSENGCG